MRSWVVRDAFTARRARNFGNEGERLAQEVLSDAGFTNVRNLNHEKSNFPYGDIYAERSGKRYVISVKIRNKFERTGVLNGRYKLGARCQELARQAEEALGAEAAWLAISLEREAYSAYFGPLSQLGGGLGIPMTAKAVRGYECLVDRRPHTIDHDAFKNVYALLE